MTSRFLAVALALFTATSVFGQTVTYVRPSKGKALNVATDVSLDAPNAGVTSAVYDWSAFMAVQGRISLTKNGVPATPQQCVCDVEVTTTGAPTPDGVFTTETDYYGQLTLVLPTPTATINIGNLSPYIKFKVAPKVGSCVRPVTGGCKASLTVVPFPLDQNVRVTAGVAPAGFLIQSTAVSPVQMGGVYHDYNAATGFLTASSGIAAGRFDRNTALVTTGGTSMGNNSIVGPVAINAVGATTVYTVGALQPASTGCSSTYSVPATNNTCLADQNNVTIQNVGTNAAYCAFIATTAVPPVAAVTSANFQFVLAGGAVAGDGTGGEKTFIGILKPFSAIQCVTSAGVSSIAVTPF